MATTILVQEKTRDLLKEFGRKDETYDEIIMKLMDATDKRLFFEEQKRILMEEKFSNVDSL
ncbi:MAG: hypothetical protein ABIA76_05765 [Candidatus Diapherotrites archaeon]